MEDLNLEQLLAIIPGHVYWLDKNNVYLGCNDVQAKAFGLHSRHEVIGKRNKDLPTVDAATADIWDGNNLEIMKSGISKIVEEPSILENGMLATVISHKIPIQDKLGNIIGLLGTSFDISDLKKQRDDLEEKFNQTDLPLEYILAHLPAHVYWKNKEGIYLGCSGRQAKTLGLSSAKEVIGKTDFDLPWGEKLARTYRENDLRIMSSGISEKVEERALIQGNEVVFLSFKTPLRSKQSEVVGILGISIDITKQKEAEKKLLEAMEISEAANKAKTKFLENMRHDIRTPLSGIVGISDLLNTETDKTKIKEYTASLASASNELLRLLNEVLDSVNISSGEIPLLKKRFCLGEVLENVVKLHQPIALEKQLKLTLYIDPVIPKYLIGDPVRIYRIVLELLTNALKFTKSGHVNVFAKLGKKDLGSIVVKLFVEDTGIGISREKQQDLFVQFNRLTPSYEGIYKGSGLGLTIVKQFLEDIRGEIYIDSALDKGTKFACIIPLREALLEEGPFKDSTIPLNIESSLNTDPSKIKYFKNIKMRALVVEDHPIAALIAKDLLAEQGCEVDVAGNGNEAIELSKKHQYNFILMDVGLPDLEGYEVSKNIRLLETNAAHRAFIAGLTAHVAEEKRQLCLDMGMNLVLDKPLKREMIVQLLQNCVPNSANKDLVQLTS